MSILRHHRARRRGGAGTDGLGWCGGGRTTAAVRPRRSRRDGRLAAAVRAVHHEPAAGPASAAPAPPADPGGGRRLTGTTTASGGSACTPCVPTGTVILVRLASRTILTAGRMTVGPCVNNPDCSTSRPIGIGLLPEGADESSPIRSRRVGPGDHRSRGCFREPGPRPGRRAGADPGPAGRRRRGDNDGQLGRRHSDVDRRPHREPRRPNATIKVAGAGFDTDHGLYVAVCAGSGGAPDLSKCVGGAIPDDNTTQRLGAHHHGRHRTGGVLASWQPNGSFTVTLALPSATAGTVNCVTSKCSLYTASDDDSIHTEDNAVPVTFAAPPTSRPVPHRRPRPAPPSRRTSARRRSSRAAPRASSSPVSRPASRSI